MENKVLSGGKGLKDALNKIAESMGNGQVSVGFINGATYPEDGTPVAAVAFWNEFGHGGKFPAPPRPFFRNMISEESPTWGPKIAKLAKSTSYNGTEILSVMGEDIKGALEKSINQFSTPALAPSTVKSKGFDKPLIDTSRMLNSITFKVDE